MMTAMPVIFSFTGLVSLHLSKYLEKIQPDRKFDTFRQKLVILEISEYLEVYFLLFSNNEQ